MLIQWVGFAVGSAVAADGPVAPTPADEAEILALKHRNLGWAEVGGGSAAVVAGVCVLVVGRGKAGELSDETLIVSDLRSAGGAVLGIGGLTAVFLGFNQFSRARAIRESAMDPVTFAVTPAIGPSQAGLAVVGSF